MMKHSIGIMENNGQLSLEQCDNVHVCVKGVCNIHNYTCTQYTHTLQSVMWFKGDESRQLD